ncbi:tetratricopeptide repeat protein [Tepidiphilus succinatimandens]|uniref:tetratricopeptide repeat protein n=1 Tax=Tepidiphilus succinatimandens TaxID=224436 RepID=UPI00112F3239|nr:tetratricopeptide repeat protein [Tepidiphilus succinatimandens]
MRLPRRSSLLLLAFALSGCVSQTLHSESNLMDSSYVRPLLERKPDRPEEVRAKAHIDLALAYIEIGRVDVALDELRAAAAEAPDYPPLHYAWGVTHLAIGDRVQAESGLKRALAAAPRDPDFNYAYGWFLCTGPDPASGLPYIEQVVTNPYYGGKARAYANLAWCQDMTGNREAARRSIQEAIRLEPRNTVVLYQAARLAQRWGEWDKASDYLQRLMREIDPDPAVLWMALNVERKRGDTAAFEQYAKRLRTEFPDSPEAERLQQGAWEP